MNNECNGVVKKQASYYGGLYNEHGPGVNAVASGRQIYKDIRYQKLSAIFENETAFSIHDIGFGLGHFYEFLKKRYPQKSIDFSGSEVTPQFVDHCKSMYPECEFYFRDLAEKPFVEKYDYLVFGGTFYHLAGANEQEFVTFVQRMLLNGFSSALCGMSFNLITGFVDYRSDDLFYCEVPAIIDFCAKKLSRFFTIDHASPLYEYTISAYKEEYIAGQYADDAFQKYFENNDPHA